MQIDVNRFGLYVLIGVRLRKFSLTEVPLVAKVLRTSPGLAREVRGRLLLR
jgi:hypothetical protein